jgi:gamma-glutamylcyclotransferase (GGCT)/AIG2-like uncharacterized protein YtfP
MATLRTIQVFVYGSLMRGFGNHHRLTEADFLGEGKTSPGFTLVNLGAFPGMHRDRKGGVVTGEVYAVSQAELASLDALEGHPDFYRRQLVTVNGRPVFTYILPRGGYRQAPVIESGDWHDAPRPKWSGFWREQAPAEQQEADDLGDVEVNCDICGVPTDLESMRAWEDVLLCGMCWSPDLVA